MLLSRCLNPWALDAKGKINNAQIWITMPKALELRAAKTRLREGQVTSFNMPPHLESGCHFAVTALQFDSWAAAYVLELTLSKGTASSPCLGEIKLSLHGKPEP